MAERIDPSSIPTTSSSSSTRSIGKCIAKWVEEDIQHLYMYMKSKQEENFASVFWKNPRSLYFGGEIPPVDHEGLKYNFLQVAVIFNSPGFLQLILDILEHPQVPKHWLVTKRKKDVSLKMQEILKLYLNTCSLETGDTPLHLASKFGFVECCKILMSHPLCDLTLTNYDNLTPSEVICAYRKEDSDGTFKELQKLFNDGLFYVPVFRSNSGLQPIVGKPRKCRDFSPPEEYFGLGIKIKREENAVYSLNAFAGPMPYEMANQFYNALKNPSLNSLFTPEEQSQLSKIKFLEPNRGIERIARSFANDLQLEWKEFIPFLEVFTNLEQKEGLNVSEKYWANTKQSNLHSDPLPSSSDDETKIIVSEQMSLLRLYPSHINPLCHRANYLYCYQKKFFEANAQDLTEDGDVAQSLPFSSPELFQEREPSQTLDSEKNIFMNRMKTLPANVEFFDPLNPIPVPKFRVIEPVSVANEETA